MGVCAGGLARQHARALTGCDAHTTRLKSGASKRAPEVPTSRLLAPATTKTSKNRIFSLKLQHRFECAQPWLRAGHELGLPAAYYSGATHDELGERLAQPTSCGALPNQRRHIKIAFTAVKAKNNHRARTLHTRRSGLETAPQKRKWRPKLTNSSRFPTR